MKIIGLLGGMSWESTAEYYRLINERIKIGSALIINLTIPEIDLPLEIFCTTRWIAKNREESYRFQTGISFNTYGDNKNQNRPEILEVFNKLETTVM